MTSVSSMSELLLNVERVPNPDPCRHEGGDCFACTLIATLSHLFPEREAPTFEDTDRWFKGQWAEPVGLMRRAILEFDASNSDTFDSIREAAANLRSKQDAPPTSSTWNGMDKALWAARADGWPIEVSYDMVIPQFDARQWGYGWPVVWAGDEYVRRLEAWLSAGWIAMTVVSHGGRGPVNPDGTINSTDHFLLLDGARIFWKPTESGGSAQKSEVHCVDSSRTNLTGWYPINEWERRYGGTPWMLVRKDDR